MDTLCRDILVRALRTQVEYINLARSGTVGNHFVSGMLEMHPAVYSLIVVELEKYGTQYDQLVEDLAPLVERYCKMCDIEPWVGFNQVYEDSESAGYLVI